MSSLASEGGQPVRADYLVFGRPLIGEEEIAEIVDTLCSGWIGFGPKCLQFEEDFAAYTHAKHAISVSSATAALHLGLLAAGVRRDDEVITTPLTFAATANVIVNAGARPVFVDVEHDTQNIDPGRIEAAVTERTRAILPVHMTGVPCDMEAVGRIAERHGLQVIEDAAHAIETWYKGAKIGSISGFTAFSFYATKNLTTAEGGMLTTDDDTVVDRLKVLRLHGLNKDAWKRHSSDGFVPYETVEPGFKYNMTDLQASLGLHQLARLEHSWQIRQRIWQQYDNGLGGFEGMRIPRLPRELGTRCALHLYTIQLELERLEIDRLQFIQALDAENIGTGIHFIPIHLHQFYRETYGYGRGAFPNSEDIGDRTVSLPLSASMSDEDVDDVIGAVGKLMKRYRRSTSVAVEWEGQWAS